MSNLRGQISLEYLLVLAAFFAALVIFLPAVNYATEKVFESSSAILAKNISNKLSEECSLFSFLGDGSKKYFHFVNTNKLSFSSNGKTISVSSGEKEFAFECTANSFSFSTEKSVDILMKKSAGSITFEFE